MQKRLSETLKNPAEFLREIGDMDIVTLANAANDIELCDTPSDFPSALEQGPCITNPTDYCIIEAMERFGFNRLSGLISAANDSIIKRIFDLDNAMDKSESRITDIRVMIEELTNLVINPENPVRVITSRERAKKKNKTIHQFNAKNILDIPYSEKVNESSLRFLLDNDLDPNNVDVFERILTAILQEKKEESERPKRLQMTDVEYSGFNQVYKQTILDILLLPLSERGIYREGGDVSQNTERLINNIEYFQEYLSRKFLTEPESIIELFNQSDNMHQTMIIDILTRRMFGRYNADLWRGNRNTIVTNLQRAQISLGQTESKYAQNLILAISNLIEFSKETFDFVEALRNDVQTDILPFEEPDTTNELQDILQKKLEYTLRHEFTDVVRNTEGVSAGDEKHSDIPMFLRTFGICKYSISSFARETDSTPFLRIEYTLDSGVTFNLFYGADKKDVAIAVMPTIFNSIYTTSELEYLDIFTQALLIGISKGDNKLNRTEHIQKIVGGEGKVFDTQTKDDITISEIDVIYKDAQVETKQLAHFYIDYDGKRYELYLTLEEMNIISGLETDKFKAYLKNLLEDSSNDRIPAKVTLVGPISKQGIWLHEEFYDIVGDNIFTQLVKDFKEETSRSKREAIISKLLRIDIIGATEILLNILVSNEIQNRNL